MVATLPAGVLLEPSEELWGMALAALPATRLMPVALPRTIANMKPATQLETDRLLLRSIEERDLVPLAALWRDPEVTRYLGGPREAEALERGLREDIGGSDDAPFDLMALVVKETGELIGHCGLLKKEIDGAAEAELVYVLASAAWGYGYATEIAHALSAYARDTLRLTRLVALIAPENGASERVARRIGMTPQGVLKRPDGRNRVLYSVLL